MGLKGRPLSFICLTGARLVSLVGYKTCSLTYIWPTSQVLETYRNNLTFKMYQKRTEFIFLFYLWTELAVSLSCQSLSWAKCLLVVASHQRRDIRVVSIFRSLCVKLFPQNMFVALRPLSVFLQDCNYSTSTSLVNIIIHNIGFICINIHRYVTSAVCVPLKPWVYKIGDLLKVTCTHFMLFWITAWISCHVKCWDWDYSKGNIACE